MMKYLPIFILLVATQLYGQDIVEIDLTNVNRVVVRKIVSMHDSEWHRHIRRYTDINKSLGHPPTSKDSLLAVKELVGFLKVDGNKLRKVTGFRSYKYRTEYHKPVHSFIYEYVISDIEFLPRYFHWLACYLCDDDNLIELLSDKKSSRNSERTMPISMMALENINNGKIMSFWMVGDKYKTSTPEPTLGLSDTLNNAFNKMFGQIGKAMTKMYQSTYLIVRILYDKIETIGPTSLVKKVKGGVEVLINDKNGDTEVYRGRIPIKLLIRENTKKR